MINAKQIRRLFALAAVLFLVFTGLGVRLVFLQVLSHDRYRRIADNNTQSLSVRQPRRGDILDANGNPIAVSIPVKPSSGEPGVHGSALCAGGTAVGAASFL